ncbi:hypothetical protein CHARACLAT_016537 [Characodon lateralis]|uniref:C-type lectin domain-containing protein n=1 Tax=Characodon lateralis TaxID=208331 RepID=A0ABU7EU70_9TELE|nr:hypothetical protein [Characodon lateralis]
MLVINTVCSLLHYNHLHSAHISPGFFLFQSFLTEKGKLKYWIGLRQDGSIWNWVNNNELEQSYWKETAQIGDCAYLNSEGPVQKNWDRASCQTSTYFICQLQY